MEKTSLIETIHGQTITYDDYRAVVIENYPDGLYYQIPVEDMSDEKLIIKIR